MSEEFATDPDWEKKRKAILAKGAAPVRKKRAAAADLAREIDEAPIAAEPDPGPADDPGPTSPDPAADAGDAPPERPRKGRKRGEIFDDCPVVPLGVNGQTSWYLDRHGQLVSLSNFERARIMHLFGDRLELLCLKFARYDKDGKRMIGTFDSNKATMTLIEAASEKGLFNPHGTVRGVGAWKDDDGNLVYHTGDELLIGDTKAKPGDHQGKIYPAYPPIPKPAAVAVKGNPGEEVLGTLSTWCWARPGEDPMVALGVICAQMMGGALDWRPPIWLTGGKSSGKSTFQRILELLHGPGGLIQSMDPTKSGITSQLGTSSLPVAVDELEPGDEGSNKEADIIKLARVAASGGQWLRGTADQKGASGNVYSSFLFSSILIPGVLGAQDRSRLIVLKLNAFPDDAKPPSLDPRTWRERGARLKRVLIERWSTWSERLELWRDGLAEFKVTGRNADNWSTVLALSDMALSPDLPTQEVLRNWSRKIAFMTTAEREDIGSDADDMITWLLGQPFDVWRRGEQFTIAHWLMAAAGLTGAPKQLISSLVGDGGSSDGVTRELARATANEHLARIGLRVRIEAGGEPELFMPNKTLPGLCKIFERSQWANGVWKQSAERIPGATPTPSSLTIAGQRTRGVYVPFRSIGGLFAFPMDSAAVLQSGPAIDPDDFGFA